MFNKTTLNFENELNNIIKPFTHLDYTVHVGATKEQVKEIAKYNFDRNAVVVSTNGLYLEFGKKVSMGLQEAEVEFDTMLLEDDIPLFVENFKGMFSFKGGELIFVLGDVQLVGIVRYYAAKKDCVVVAIPTNTNLEFVGADDVILTTACLPKKTVLAPLISVIIDKVIIEAEPQRYISSAFGNVISKFISLLDYRLRVLTDGVEFNKTAYDTVKKAVIYALSIKKYTSPILVLALAELCLAFVKSECDILSGGAESSTSYMLKAEGVTLPYGDRVFFSFEKLIKLYYLFFSNPRVLLLSPNYNEDIEEVSSITKIDKSEFYNRLNIPNSKRYKLLNSLFEKVKDFFIKETASVIKILPDIKRIYSEFVTGDENKRIIKNEELKKAIKLAPYVSDKTNVLTFIRDFGFLSCVN